MYEFWKSLSPFNKLKFILSLTLGIIGVVFATLNWNSYELHLIFTKRNMPLTLMLFFSMFTGIALGYVFRSSASREKDKKIAELQNEIDRIKSETISGN